MTPRGPGAARTGWLALASAVLLAAAAPPGWFGGAGLLVLPGLAAFYAVATLGRRPALWSYVLGVAYMAAFSWSLRHVSLGGYLAIAVLGGLYWVLAVAWTRVLARWIPAPWAFGLAVAGTHWLRGALPELAYPHGQPVHALYHWPWLLGPVAWGSEPAGNLLLAALAGALVDAGRSWRAGRPPWRQARRRLAGIAVVVAVATVVWPPAPWRTLPAARIDVLAIEPGFEPGFQTREDFWQLYREALLEPTAAAAGPRAAAPPDLVLWPETSYPAPLETRPPPPRLSPRALPALAAGTLLVTGTVGLFPDGRRTPVAVAVDRRGTVHGIHEKRMLVAGGEYLPYHALLPQPLRRALAAAVARTFGSAPDFEPGGFRPPMVTATGVPFGAMLCYDNAFPGIARGLVAAGARFLVVLSNEAWYRRGAELAQLEASTVCRAVETRTPIVRCTVDGSTLAVDAGGRIVARLPWQGTERRPRSLRVGVEAAAGALPPLSWLQPLAAWTVALSGLALVWRVARRGARLLRARLGSAPHRDPRAVP